MKKDKKIRNFLLLLIPLIIALFLLIYMKASQNVTSVEYMAPLDNAPVITAILVFMFGYACFLILMFLDDIKSFLAKAIK